MKVLKTKKINLANKTQIIKKLTKFLSDDINIMFAYLYGSFNESTKFNDIDIAVYYDDSKFSKKTELHDYNLSLCTQLECVIKSSKGKTYEIDLHELNFAPLGFRFSIITNGILLVSNDDDNRVEFEARTRDLYFDFFPHFEYYYRVAILGENI